MYRADRPDPNAIARARRAAEAPRPLRIPDGAGIHLLGGAGVPASIGHLEAGKQTSQGDLRVPYSHTLLWDPAIPLRLELVPAGFNFLHYWHVAAPLFDYNSLGFQHGTLEERMATAERIRDLRVPLYETRALFVRQCPEVDELLEAWARERQGDADERLAFHRALWEVKPLILPLPITWVEGKFA